ncbi:hypothetical protein WICPIJ_003825 [Wickerhamomyces pijperi]|uniref:CinA C-terminal domain-containing protein n=1 Tax=Wickerhamomyces pijperi TaxID=599730 RepID=A0A9P8Q742_WICPI|nr:hypothetical protein WICPIJ_003825 [Wickerhamomyces pijperi]
MSEVQEESTYSAFPPEQISPLVEQISQLLQSHNSTLSISEGSCGGLLSSYLVSQAGASKWYQGGTLIYSLNSRLKLNGWSQKEINEYTGPSERVALRLARNLRIELGSEYVLSETGIAGGREYKNLTGIKEGGDVGTVFLAVSTPQGEFSKCVNTGVKERHVNMQLFAKLGLEFLLEVVKDVVAKSEDQKDFSDDDQHEEEEEDKEDLDQQELSNNTKKVKLSD